MQLRGCIVVILLAALADTTAAFAEVRAGDRKPAQGTARSSRRAGPGAADARLRGRR